MLTSSQVTFKAPVLAKSPKYLDGSTLRINWYCKLSVTVIIVGNGIHDSSSNTERGCLYFTLGKSRVHLSSYKLWVNNKTD